MPVIVSTLAHVDSSARRKLKGRIYEPHGRDARDSLVVGPRVAGEDDKSYRTVKWRNFMVSTAWILGFEDGNGDWGRY